MFGFNKSLEVYAPISGRVMSITETPDEVFAAKIVGNGVCIDPEEGLVVSPVDGEVVMVFETNHAIGLKASNGAELLIHIGLNTVEMKGEGFERLIKEGQKVKKGTPLMKFDIELIKSKGFPVITPVIVTGEVEDSKISANIGINVKAGEDIVFTYKAK